VEEVVPQDINKVILTPVLQVDRKRPNQLYLRSVPKWASLTVIETALQPKIQSCGCDARITNIILPREKIPPGSQVQ